jgi:nitrogen fixation/metabolism regulation signal transduction histidine kinase
VAFLIFIGVMLTLVRNVLKLFADEKSRAMGSRLRTRMLIGAVLVSLVPIVFMYAFSYGLMNRAMERWFSKPVTQIRDDSNQLALELSDYTVGNARVEAESIAANLPPLSAPGNAAAIQRILREHEVTLQGGFVVVFHEGKAIAGFNMPQRAGEKIAVKRPTDQPARIAADEETEQPITRAEDQPVETIDPADPTQASLLAAAERGETEMSLAHEDYALGAAPVLKKSGGLGNVIVALPLPRGMSETINRLHKETEDYWILYRARSTIRRFYLILLAMMTSLALFASSWLALYLSKQVTKPVEALADAMASIAAGDYAHRVQASATEELGELVESFNHMAEDLEGTRSQVEAATSQLSRANSALEARSGELETMLETIPNGVATVGPDGRIALTNRALTEMLDPGGQRTFIGHTLEEVFPPEMLEALDRLMRRSHRMGSASGELESPGPSGQLNLLLTVALLESGAREHFGYVLVVENATELLRAQKQSAWKEVARRVAHEIKNPLTPISLSAEQISRHIERLAPANAESPSIAVIRRCAQVISGSVESMRSLVDQFASLAQFPTAQPRPADLNTIVENSLALFAGRTQNISLTRKLDGALPLVLADPEAMKRALGNLIDNAVEAMAQSLLRELRVSTSLLPSGLVELTIADTGAGLTDEMRERLFLPYFSTKQRGTGLGLAIAAKIIQEHGGTIRAEKHEPAGAKFIVELRPASMADLEPTPEAETVSH